MAECIFCKILQGEIPSTEVESTDRWVAIRDVNPQAPTHILIIPRHHIATLDDLKDEDRELTGELVLAATRIARHEGLVDGGYRLIWNCGAGAGQSVFHLHLHLLGGRPFSWPPG